MENQIYMFYNKLSMRYEGVFSSPTDATMLYRMGKPDAFNRDELEIVKVGSFDLTSGVVTPTAPVRIDIPLEKENPLPVTEAR